jgi:hypothetical protein
MKTIDRAIVKDRRPQADATNGPGVGPDPFDEGVVLTYPGCGSGGAFGQSPTPFAHNVIAALKHVQRESLVQRGA